MSRVARLLSLPVLVALALAVLSAPASAASDVILKKVLSGYDQPVLVTHAARNGRIVFIVEQTGKIKLAIRKKGEWRKLGTFLDLSGRVLDPNTAGHEQGLLGLAFHPNYSRNGLFYVNYTRKGDGDREGDTVVAEYRRRTSRRADPSSRRVLKIIDQPTAFHNGGHLTFGPDGRLYIGMGDGGGSSGTSQDKGSLMGKMLRIDPRDPDGKGPRSYSVPKGNPFVGKVGKNEIWSVGLRNPWRFSFDRKNGNLWIGDAGQKLREEVDLSRSNDAGRRAGRGRNYGWDDCEGSLEFNADEGDPDDDCSRHVLPLYEYGHEAEDACAIVGGYVYRGPNATAWHGLYIAGDHCGRMFVLGSKGKVKLLMTTPRELSSFGEDSAGRLYLADLSNGNVYLVKLSGPRP